MYWMMCIEFLFVLFLFQEFIVNGEFFILYYLFESNGIVKILFRDFLSEVLFEGNISEGNFFYIFKFLFFKFSFGIVDSFGDSVGYCDSFGGSMGYKMNGVIKGYFDKLNGMIKFGRKLQVVFEVEMLDVLEWQDLVI